MSRTPAIPITRSRGKPVVSAASYKTRRVGAGSLDAGEIHLRELLAERDVLVQRYLPSVEDHGERALVWVDGELTHAVRKTPRFEGEDESVSVDAVAIAPAEAALARRAIVAAGQALINPQLVASLVELLHPLHDFVTGHSDDKAQ